MNIKLSDHFDYKRLLRFALPSIIMMIFTSIYCIVDGFLYQIMPARRRLRRST